MNAKKKFKLNSIKCTLFTFSIIIVFIYECIVLFTNKPFMYNEYKVISYKETLIKVNNNRAKFPYRTKINVEYLNEYKVKCSKTIEFSEKVDKNKNFIYNNLIQNNKLFVLKGFYDKTATLLHITLFAVSGFTIFILFVVIGDIYICFFDCPDKDNLKKGFSNFYYNYTVKQEIIEKCGNCPLCKLEICINTPLKRDNLDFDEVQEYYKTNPPLVKINLYKFLGIKYQKIQEYINDHKNDLYGPYYGMTYKALLNYKKSS